jgi:hypothetical protein
MKRLYTICALLGLLLLGPGLQQEASAQFRIGPFLGINFDGSTVFLGGEAQFGVRVSDNVSLIAAPSLDLYLFEDNVTFTRINLDAVFPFDISGFEVYGGGGLFLQFTSIDLPGTGCDFIDCSDMDVGVNLRGGTLLGSPESSIRPFVEINIALGDGSDVAARGGVLFQIRAGSPQ